MARDGIEFAWLKASEGGDHRDTMFTTNCRLGSTVGLARWGRQIVVTVEERIMGLSVASIATSVVILLAAFGIIAIARRAAYGNLRRNHWAGIRTPTSSASDEAWDGIHELAAPGLIRIGRATFLIGLFATFVDPNANSILSFVVIGLVLAVAIALVGVSVRAHHRWTVSQY